MNSDKTFKVILNVSPDKPTVNGHVYPEDMLLKALDDAIKRGLPVYKGYTKDDSDEIIGVVTGRSINEDGVIVVYGQGDIGVVDEYSTHLTTCGTGEINKDKVISDFTLKSLFPVSEGEDDE